MVIDKSNYIHVLEQFPKQCREALQLPKGMIIKQEFTNIVACGMGGSAVGGDLLKAYMYNRKIPVHVIKDYNLPGFVNEYSLVFCISYSGNTEETLSCLEEAKKRNANIVAITSNGTLSKSCKNVIEIPAGLQPRAALGYLFLPMIALLHNSNAIRITNEEMNEMLAKLKDVEYYKAQGDLLAKKIRNKIPIIYSSSLFEPVAYRWKTQFNENSKWPAFYSILPEMNHNEIVGLPGLERKNHLAIFIRSEFDHPRIKKRFDICKEIFEERIDVEEIYAKGDYLITQLFTTIFLGDFASYYLALQNHVDPAPVYVIENLKVKMNE